MNRWVPLAGAVLAACGGDAVPDYAMPPWVEPVARVEGLAGPEAVRYDPDQDVWFVANFNGENTGDANGFIARVAADGSMEVREFMVGTAEAPMHGPRGMFIVGDTLWAADADGVHGFDRRTGAHLAFVDLRPLEPGFLNDVTQGPDGALYVTDTGRPRVYRLARGTVTVALEGRSLSPNGITWDAANRRFLLASWAEGNTVYAWDGADGLTPLGHRTTGRNDGIEIVAGGVLVASQSDSTIHLLADTTQRPILRVAGRPADIGVDTRRGRVAVPYIALDRVDIWDIPARN